MKWKLSDFFELSIDIFRFVRAVDTIFLLLIVYTIDTTKKIVSCIPVKALTNKRDYEPSTYSRALGLNLNPQLEVEGLEKSSPQVQVEGLEIFPRQGPR